MGALPPARGRRRQVSLGSARGREGRAARRARPEELEAEEVARRAAPQAMMQLKKLGAFGAQADAVDLAGTFDFAEVEKAFFANQLLVFRKQRLNAGQFLSYARRFGPPEPHVIDQFHHPEHSDILVLSNVVKDGKPTGLADAGTY